MEGLGYLIGGYNSQTPEFNGNGQSAKSRLQSFGLDFSETGLYKKVLYIAIDHSVSDLKKARDMGIDANHSILVINEPKVVRPSNFDPQVQLNYGMIVVVGGNPKAYKSTVNWPQPWRSHKTDIRIKRIQKPVIIVSNRISFMEGENYSLRRKVISDVGGIDYFGRDWGYSLNEKIFHLMSNFKIAVKSGSVPRIASLKNWFKSFSSSGGEIPDKNVILQKYAYSVTIENSNGYLSEKLFDCFFNFTIPIYVGPNPSDYGIPEDLVVHCAGNLKGVKDGIQRARQIDYARWCVKLDEWLTRPETLELWESTHVYSILSKKITDYGSSLVE
jgi:hypothetical protein